MDKYLTINGQKIDAEEYIADTLYKADEFCNTALLLVNRVKTLDDVYVLEPAGYLASHAAELYLKALIVGYLGSEGYEQMRKVDPKHDLIKLLNILTTTLNEAESLKRPLEDLNKYSGDKIRFVEYDYSNQEIKDYGNNEISQIIVIKNFTKHKFGS